jgi:omega-amidase
VRDLTITLLQTELHWQDPAANRAMFADLIAEQAATTDLIVLPEMFTSGFTMNASANSEATDGPTTTWLQQMATEYNVAVCGSLVVNEAIAGKQHCYNRLLWAAADGSMQSYDKRHLFRMADEDQHYTAGAERLIVELNGWRICPLICYDLRFPVWSRGSNQFDLLLYVANWPAPRQSAWDALLPARAVENLCYAAGVNRVGTDGNGVSYSGGSVIVDYLANVSSAGDKAGALQSTLDGSKLERYRDKFPAWKDADGNLDQ